MPRTTRKSRWPAKQASTPAISRTIAAGCSYPCGSISSDLAPAFERLVHRHLVRVLEVAADRHAHGDAGHLDAERLQEPREIQRGGFAFDVRVGGENDLPDA